MSGAIFRNKRKEKAAHPDRSGQCTIAGVEYWISGWIHDKSGEQYLSLEFKPKQAEQQREARKPYKDDDEDDGRIPF